jgi:hypothetical protein
MNVKIKSDREWAEVELPEDTTVLTPPELEALPNVQDHFQWVFHRKAFGGANLSEMMKNKKNICVAIHSMDRMGSVKDFLSPLIHALKEASLPKENIIILIAAGPNGFVSQDQFQDIFGEYAVTNATIVNHNPENDKELSSLGKVEGVPFFMNRYFLNADLKIIAGPVPLWNTAVLNTIESVYLGILSGETLSGFLEKEESLLQVFYPKAPADYLISFTLLADGGIGSLFCGNPREAFGGASAYVYKNQTIPVKSLSDVLVTGSAQINSFSTFINLLQVSPAVKPGGTIVCAAQEEKKHFTRRKYHDILGEWFLRRALNMLKNYRIVICNAPSSSVFPAGWDRADSLNEAVKKIIEAGNEEMKITVLPQGMHVRMEPEAEEGFQHEESNESAPAN